MLFYVAIFFLLANLALSVLVYQKSVPIIVVLILVVLVMIIAWTFINLRFQYALRVCDSQAKILFAKKMINWRLFYIYASIFLVICGIEIYREFTSSRVKDSLLMRNITIFFIMLFNVASILFLFRFYVKEKFFHKTKSTKIKPPRYYIPLKILYVMTTIIVIIFSILDMAMSHSKMHMFYPIVIFINMFLFIMTSLLMYKSDGQQLGFQLPFLESISGKLCTK